MLQQPPALLGVLANPVVWHGVADEADETVGEVAIVGIVGTGPGVNAGGDTLNVGTAAAELTPRLPISTDPSGIPVRATPPGAVGDVGADDEAMLAKPEPHIPDNPDVSIIPEVVDIPEVADISDDDIAAPGAGMAAVAGVVVPTAIPPPSSVDVDPYIPDGEVPYVEQDAPLLGVAIEPVE